MEEHSRGEENPHITSGMRDFQAAVNYCALTDLASHGPLYTWSNRQEGDLISKKLDRVLVNDCWKQSFPHSYNVFEAGGCSDHLRCRINLNMAAGARVKGKKPFKFINAITDMTEFKPMVEDYWSKTEPIFMSTSSMFRFTKKLKALKPKIRHLAKERMGNLTKKTKEAYETLCEKQETNLKTPSPQAMEEEATAHDRWERLAGIEEKFLKQKSKLHWLKVGDKNNKTFHREVMARVAQNSIREIQRQDGSVTAKEEEIKEEAERFFREFLQLIPNDYEGATMEDLADLLPFRCNDDEKERLIRPITEMEIKEVLFSMPNDKSPGPDGFTTEFYKETWDIIAGDRRFGYHPRCKSIGLTHLTFADDLMVLSDGKIRSIEGIMEVFDQFAKRSGLKISVEKSTIYLAGISDSGRCEIESHFQFAVGCLPVRYLGLPLVTKRLTSTDYSPLLEHIRKKIGTWTARFLSYAGRLNLVSSVLWSICNFWLAAFRLPRECIKEIDKICSAFLWSGPDLNAHKAKVAWEAVCRPKKEGGLGLRSIHEANDVCCLKLIWRLISHADSLWVTWIKTNLLKQDTFWSVKQTYQGSWMWKKLLKFREVARDFCKVDVKNGERTSFRYDNWSSMGPLFDAAGERGQIVLGISKHKKVAEAWVGRRHRLHRAELHNKIERELLSTWRNRAEEEDIVLWKGKNNLYRPRFSTKDTWQLTRTVSNEVAWHKSVWFAHATPKFSFCVWLAAQNRLSTGDKMTHWNRGLSTGCVLCNNTFESRDHLFFSCRFSTEVWQALAKNIYRSRYSTNWHDLIGTTSGQWQNRIISFLARYIFQATIHAIWRERNGRRHGEDPNPPARLIKWIDKQVKNQLSSIKATGDRRYDTGLQIWFAARS
ncbi:Reverse transcriptase domain [Arabidopsis thaliana x Arabidopsis arenosa]|uniref:Reverse transcriptase domain n=1 Tax=Arabidopsis thaliana x Arabidopsis arenosa TaxID=1240361 RepID=A0A8T1Y5T6_9BRAS|nr:Reverse transcriptase domain [Arabidopsis thaliana x Arabidopsis arenosa]